MKLSKYSEILIENSRPKERDIWVLQLEALTLEKVYATEKVNNWCEEIIKLSEFLKPNLMQLIQHFAMVKYTNLHTF